MTTFAPCHVLAPYVRAFEVVEAREETTRTLLPEAGLIVGFRFSGAATLLGEDLRVPDRVVTGLRSSVRRMRTSAGGGMVLAKFHTGAAAPFVELGLHELFGATCSLDELFPRDELDEVEDRIALAGDHQDRVAAFEAFLLKRRCRARDRVALAAARAIQATPSIRVRALADELGLSQDALEKRFRREIGASPKRFASMLRLRSAIDSYGPGESLAQLALDAGYYDQSHFIRDFREATGTAPRRFFEQEELG
ncbi:Transcriptional regulator, AraC family [Vulgatibacter incomptus]|uniref:Transcriptional regulator, AraC family n=1 Tax=Vulgatibacter incomptus TaxID=1391653 RepID=A0A0K1PGE7_9BACT|nr:Transcriptional regulator, AraC family [Vulgatibacter incomptus]